MASFVRQYVITCNFKDGAADPKTLTSREQFFALKDIPKFVDYFCYNFFVGSIMVGPFIEFRTFNDWIHLRGKFENTPQWGQMSTFFKRFCTFAVTLLTCAYLSSIVSFEYMQTEEWANDPRGFLYRACYLIVTVQLFWEGYFGGFCMMDCTLIACGIGYEPETEQKPANYNSITNVRILALD